MKILRVITPGLFTTVQDLGRYGYLRYGVPICGAMDTFSFVAANLLVDNNPTEACLETTLISPELEALETANIAITGGTVSPQINGQDVSMWQTVEVQKGDFISFGRMQSGCRAYISIRGGIDAPLVLGSRSTYVRGGFGGVKGRQLRKDDIIEGREMVPLTSTYAMPRELVPQFAGHFIVNVVLGPQMDKFTEKGVDTLLSNPFSVSLDADRMGYRLEGPTIEHEAEADIVSDGVLPGAIQVPKNGKPIIMMRDAQTTGGYPKIAAVITSDASLLGQAKPNDMIEFSRIPLNQAHKKFCEHWKLLNSLDTQLVRKG